MESGLDGSDGRPQHGRDLSHRTFLEVVQDEDGSVVDRKSGEGSIECICVSNSVGERRSGRGRLPVVLGAEKSNLADLRSTSTPKLGPTGVQIDASEPGVERFRVAQSVAVAPGRNEGFLRGVGCVGLTTENGE